MSPAEKAAPVVIYCRICGKGYYNDRQHICDLEPVARAQEAQKRKIPVEFHEGWEIKEILEWLTCVCGRNLAVPPGVEMVLGRYYIGSGYVWSWRKGIETRKFTIFAGNVPR